MKILVAAQKRLVRKFGENILTFIMQVSLNVIEK